MSHIHSGIVDTVQLCWEVPTARRTAPTRESLLHCNFNPSQELLLVERRSEAQQKCLDALTVRPITIFHCIISLPALEIGNHPRQTPPHRRQDTCASPPWARADADRARYR